MMIDAEEVVMRGRALPELPINGVGYVRAEDQNNAEEDALNLIEEERITTTWLISIYVDGELVSPDGIELTFTLTEHELVSLGI